MVNIVTSVLEMEQLNEIKWLEVICKYSFTVPDIFYVLCPCQE
jgi:hypothetical protein